ncbi:aKG-HExxH-type peptide beta-hydroxylase [Pseudalkalibacillus berkeleyi]|uniref:HEXXH motif-containing putative peptide modification protein n=1 Tax=Pseudalkalibacillus berkeleyi TaxID=1069813 RepID=A0ABS9GXU6_9BACL|nr:HEXXH motif-containing putative peptide modification protein [Pseudalkalibacillus berkeleyi]MCF6136454.1 HEXXH motif-containing putative peptide modification protein [Pseudalkalibacillus berkeleyi]
MENDQIYKLSIRYFSKKLETVLRKFEKSGSIPPDIASNIKDALYNPDFIRDVYHPGLNYFISLMKTFSTEEFLNKINGSNLTEKFMNYLIVPCAKHGVTLRSKIECNGDGIIDIPSLNYKIKLADRVPNCSVITSKNKVTFLIDGVSMGSIRIEYDSNIQVELTDAKDISLIRKSCDTTGVINFELTDSTISQYLAENSELLNIRKKDLEDNQFRSIEFTTNDHAFYNTCLNSIRDIWPEYYLEIEGHIKLIAIMDTNAFGGFTSGVLPDAIFLSHNPYDYLWVTENIIHECAHSRLDQLFVIDPIILNDDDERYKSPWREDPRPLKGVLHGAYAFARVAIWLEKLHHFYPVDEVLNRLDVVKQQLSEAIEVIEKNGYLSPIGEHLFKEISSVVKPLSYT